MLKDIDFSNLEEIHAFKNISICDDNTKLILYTMTYVDKKDSIAHLEGLELAFAKNELEKNKKYIQLAAVFKTVNDEISTDSPIKALFTGVNTPYRNVYRTEMDDLNSVLEDVVFVEQVFNKSTNKFVYL